MKTPAFFPLLLLAGLAGQAMANDFHCPRGVPATAGLGDGVIMRTCLWERAPGDRIRVGPIELIKNGIMILKTQTDASGKLHGDFISWDDNGKVIEKGSYSRGLKQGEWLVVDAQGKTTIRFYRDGILIEP